MKVKTLIEKLETTDPNSEVFLLVKNDGTGIYMEVDCDTISQNHTPIESKKVRGLIKKDDKEKIEWDKITVTLEGTIVDKGTE